MSNERTRSVIVGKSINRGTPRRMRSGAVASISPPRLNPCTAAVCLALFSYVAPAVAQQIVTDGRTATNLSTHGNVTDVTTGTVRGANAFNSFARFNVDAGNIVNLHLPGATQNLLNLVRDERTNIHGILNALRDGRIGGNVYFANPHGFVVGAQGVINVGSLAVSTPTQSFVDNFFVVPGDPNEAAVQQLLSGTAPRNGTGLISIQGTINAIDAVSLLAGTINIGGSIYAGARFINDAPDFIDVVNVNGVASGDNVVVSAGRILLVADNDVAVAGTIAAQGASGVAGGDIDILAGRNVTLDAGANIVARGNGANSDGGTVHVWAENDSTLREGARIDASAGTSGDGGFIEFSAKRTVTLEGGELAAGAANGAAGSILIDPENLIISSATAQGVRLTGGANATFQADEAVTIADGTLISSRNLVDGPTGNHDTGLSAGDSGNLTFTAKTIDVGSGAQIYAHANNGHQGGDVSFVATNSTSNPLAVDIDTRIELSGATVKGRDVTLTASSSYTSPTFPIPELPVVVKNVSAVIDVDSSTIVASRNIAMHATSSADVTTPDFLPLATIAVDSNAQVDVRGNSRIESSGGNADLNATSNVTAKAVADTPDLMDLPGDAGVAIVIVDSNATVDIGGNSVVDVSGALSLNATNTVDAEARADASASGSTAVGGTVAVSVIDTTTRAAISDNATVSNAGSVTLDAESINTIVTSAKAAAGGAGEKGASASKTEETLADYQDEASTSDGGVTVAAAVAVSDLSSTTQAYLNSANPLASTGAVSVTSKALNQSDVTADGSSSEGGVGVGAGVAINIAGTTNEAYVAQAVNANGVSVAALMAGAGESNRFTASSASGAAASDVGVAGSLAANIVENRSSALITGAGAVNAGGGDVRIEAKNESGSTTKAVPGDTGAATGETVGIGASVAMNIATNETRAELSNGAQLYNADDITLSATGKHSNVVEAEAGAAGGIGVTPVLAMAVVDNSTTARLGTGGTVTLNGDWLASATHSGTTATSAKADVAGEKAAIGAAVAITLVNDTAVASAARSIHSGAGGIAFAAHADSTSGSIAKASAKGGKSDESGDTQDDGVDQEIGKQTSFGKNKQGAGSANAGQQSASAETAGDGGSSSKVSVAAAIAVNVADSNAEASVADGNGMWAGGDVLSLDASNNTDASAAADGSTVGDSAVGIGAAVAINVASSTNLASLGAGTHNAQGLMVAAVMKDTGDTTSTFGAEATSGAGSGDVGVAGSLGLNIVDHSSVATVANGAAVNVGNGDISIEAENRSESTAKALPAEGGTSGAKVGIGASVALNIIANESRAELANGATLDNGGDMSVDAVGEHVVITEAEAGSSGGISITPVVALTVSDNQTIARFGSGDALDGFSGGVSVSATHSSDITTTAKGSSQGEKAAVGIAVGVTIANDSAIATTNRNITNATGDVQFIATASQSTSTSATASAKGGKAEKKTGAADDTPDDGVDKEVTKQTSFGQSKQKAGSANQTQSPDSAQTSEGKLSVAAAVSVNVADSKAEAFIPDGRAVDTDGALTVSASNNTDAKASADGSAAGSTATVGIGAAVAINSANAASTAYIGDANVTANGVAVRSLMTDVGGDTTNTFGADAKAGAGGGKVGIAGALALNLIDVSSTAEIHSGAAVNAGGGDVELEAQSNSSTTAKALPDGPASGGQVGIGASVAMNLFSQDLTRAQVGANASIDNANNITLTAASDSDTVAEAEAGAAGSIALDAVVAYTENEQKTEAIIASGAGLVTSGAVGLTATATGDHKATATGDVKSKKVGVGASAAIILSDTSTTASIERNITTGNDAADHLNVAASATRTYEAVASASAGGGKSEDQSSQQEKDKAKSTSTLKDNQSAQQGTDKTGSSSKVNVAAAAGVLVLDDDVSASIAAGRTLDVGGDIGVSAFNSSDFSARGLGDTLNPTNPNLQAQVGIGVGVGISIVRNDTTATIGSNSHILDAADIAVEAESKQNTSTAYANKLAAEGIAGAGSSKVSVAGALAVANSNATTVASIGDNVEINDADNVSITADNTSKLSAKAWSAAVSQKVGVGASIAVIVSDNEYRASLGNNAVLGDGANHIGGLTVAARNHKISGGVPFDWSLDGLQDRFTEANLQSLLGNSNYYTESIAGAGAGQVAVTGAFSVNVFDDVTEASIGQGTDIRATGAVDVAASNDTTAKAFAGGVSAAGKVGVGIATADIVNSGETRAYIADGVQIHQAGSVGIDAAASLDLTTISASAAAAGTAGVSGVLSLITSDNVVEAYAGDNTTINSNDAAAISASNDFKALTVAGVAGVGGTAGVGVSVGTNVVNNETRAWIGENATVNAAGLTSVDAASSEDVSSVVVGGAGGGTAGVAASAAANVFDTTTQASIGSGAQVNATNPLANQSVRVSADTTTEVLSIVGTVGIGGTAGVGGAADVMVIDKTTQAWIAGGTDVRAGNDIGVSAGSSEELRSIGAGFSAGGTAGVQGAASVVTLTTDTQAYIAGGATAHSEGNVVVAASGESELDMLAGAGAIGGTAGVGAAAAVAVVDKTTHAYIGNGAEVTALGKKTGTQAATGAFGISYATETATDGEVSAPNITPSNGEDDVAGGSDALTKKRVANAGASAIRGLAVTATNKDDIESYAVTGAASGTASVTLSGDVSVFNADTQAWIGNNAKINETNTGADAAQSVRVAAGNDFYRMGIAGALAASGTVGVGIGADVAVMNHVTKAQIGNSALVNARKDVSVAASLEEEVLSISASLGASGTVGVSGSVSALVFDNETWASIGNGATVNADGNVAVTAEDNTDTTMVAGTVALGLGGGGVGAGVGVTVIDKDTRAWVGDNAIVDARGQNTTDMTAYSGDSLNGTTTMRGLLVEAASSEDLFTISAAGAGGLYVGIAGAVSVASVDSDTVAYIGNGADINTSGGSTNANQDVNVSARNDYEQLNVTGALGIGAAGIAGAVDVGVIRNDTTAFIGDNAEVRAARDVDVNALSSKDIETYVVSAAGGLTGIAAGVGVYSIGSGLDADSQNRLKSDDGDNAGSYADDQITDSSISDSFLAGYNDSRIRSASNKAKSARSGTAVSSSFTATEAHALPAGNAAFIGEGARVISGRHVDVDARETVDFDMLTGALAVGAVGLGAGVGVANVNSNNQAFIDNAAHITAGAAGNVTVNAQLNQQLSALGIAGTGGIVAIDAAAAVLNDNSSVIANIGNGVTIDRANLVRVDADDDRVLEAETYSVSVGAITAGASIATTTIGGETRASIGTGARIGQGAYNVNDVEVNADANHAATADALAGKAGLGLAASGTVATSTINPVVTARIGGGSITVQNDVDIDAAATVAAKGLAKGINVSLGGSVGASVALATALPVINASIGSGTTIAAGGVYVDAAQRTPVSGDSAHANATGASGGLLVGANATVAKAQNNGQVQASIGDNSTLTVSGTMAVRADNDTRQRADAAGLSFGFLALGANLAEANTNTLTRASVGNNVKLTGGTLSVSATGEDDNRADALAGSGGVISGLASKASTSSTSQAYAQTGSGSQTRAIDVDTLTVNATHTTRFNSSVNSTNASLVGASGASASNVSNSRAEARIGDNGYVLADNVLMQAGNTVVKDWLGKWNVDSGSGGLLDLPAATSTTSIVNNALVGIGNDATVKYAVETPGATGFFRLDAWNDVTARDKVKLDSGGAISVPSAQSKIYADTNNATVRVGTGAELGALGDMNFGARALGDIYAQVAGDTYGVAGAPEGHSIASFKANNRVEIGADATLLSLRDIKLGAGRNSYEAVNNISAVARTDLYNNTAIPIDTDPDADALIDTNNTIVIGNDASIRAVRDVDLITEKGTTHASGVGIGKDIYREALAEVASAISNAFGGGDVSFEIRAGSSRKLERSDVQVDGDIEVGIRSKQELVIGMDGIVTTKTDGMEIVGTGVREVADDILDRIEKLRGLQAEYAGDPAAVAAYESEIKFLERKLAELAPPTDASKPGFTDRASVSPHQAAVDARNGIDGRIGEIETVEIDPLETVNTTLTNNNTTLQGQNTNLQDVVIPGLQAQIGALDAEDDAGEIAALRSQISGHQTTIANNTTTINNNNATIVANNAEITTWTDLVGQLTTQRNQLQTQIASGELPTESQGGPTAQYNEIGDVTAQLGNIRVKADRLHGNGSLDAPGDAEIKITNHSANFLVLNDLNIPSDDGGRVIFNGVDVNTNTQINAINGVAGGAGFDSITTRETTGAPKPQIVIESKFNPLDPLYTQYARDHGLVAPDTILRGDIDNLRGLVKIESEAGSIRVEETANIRAGQIEIKTKNGDFVQSYTDAFTHVAGNPEGIQNGIESYGTGIIANGSVLIAARYLNINGTVQSGIPEWGVRIPSNATVTVPGIGGSGTFTQARNHYNSLSDAQKAAPGAEYYEVSGATTAGLSGNSWGAWEKVGVRYNARDDRLELFGVQVAGGYIELFGQIFNTNNVAGGKLRVLDGYGQIKIDNQTNLDLMLNVLDTGHGAHGEINITNIVGIGANGAPIISTTRYTRDPGQARTGESFNPGSGLRYVWTKGTDTVTEEFYRYYKKGWFDSDDLVTSSGLDSYRLSSKVLTDDPLSAGQYLRDWTADGSTDISGTHYYSRSDTRTLSKNYTPGRSWKDCNWWTLCANATHYQEFWITTGTKTIDTYSVKGDYPIGIEYIGFDQGTVNVSSTGNVMLNGSINNRVGDTRITSGGNITQVNETQIVRGTNVNLTANGSIGETSQALVVNTGDTGLLNATATNGDLNVKEIIGDLRVGNVTALNGTVKLEAERNLTAASGASVLQGRRVQLDSINGGIWGLGGSGTALNVRTGYSTDMSQWGGLGLEAHARDDINLSNSGGGSGVYGTGNLLLVAAESTAGDVRIETTGAAIDNNPFSTTDTRTVAELNDLWDSLRLRGTLAEEKADDAVKSFENGVTQQYQTYWITRQRQADSSAYDAGYSFTTTAVERAQLSANGMDAAAISAFEASKTAEYHQLHSRLYGAGADAVKGPVVMNFIEGYRYSADGDERTSITNGSSWSDAQLALSVGGGLLKNITDTVTTIKAPNAKGRNVTLIAGQGIGSFDADLQIDLSAGLAALTPEQKAALAAAERGDATLAGTIITISQPRPVNVDVGTGVLNANAGAGGALIGSEQDLRINLVEAGGDIRIKTAGSLINAATTPGTANVIGGDLILEAANGGIGSQPDVNTGDVSTPLLVKLQNGSTLIARAKDDIWIEETDGDLNVDTVFSRGDADLRAEGSILDGMSGNELNILANTLSLTAQTGSIGELLNPLEVGVNQNGRIVADAGAGSAYLHGPVGYHFNIGSVHASNVIGLGADTDMLIDGLVDAAGQVALAAGGDIAMSANAFVHANTIGALVNAGTLTMQDGAAINVDVGTIRIVTDGDMHVTGIETGNDGVNNMGGANSSIYMESLAGSIYDAGDTRLDIITDTAPAARLTIKAAGQIGGNPLDVRLLNLDSSSGGLTHINVEDGVHIDNVIAGGEVLLNTGVDGSGSMTGNNVVSTGGPVVLNAYNGNVDLGNVSGLTDVTISGGNNVTLDTVNSGNGSVYLESLSGDVSYDTGNAKNAFTAYAMGGNLSSDSTMGNAVNLFALNNLSANNVQVGSFLNFGANQIDANVTHTSTGSPLLANLSNYSGGPASYANMVMTSGVGVGFGQFSAMDANLFVPNTHLWMDQAYVGNQMTVDNTKTFMLIDQNNPAPQWSFDIQLYAHQQPFAFDLAGRVLTTDAGVIHYKQLTHTVLSLDGTSSPDMPGNVERGLSVLEDESDVQPDAVVSADASDTVTYGDTAVALPDCGKEPMPEECR